MKRVVGKIKKMKNGRISRKNLSIFAIIFALIGGYILIRSFAFDTSTCKATSPGRCYYVLPNGTGTGDSESSPAKFSNISGKPNPGDVVVFLDGNYYGNNIITRGGTSTSSYVTYVAKNKWKAVIDGQGVTDNGFTVNAPFVRIQDFEIKYQYNGGGSASGIELYGGNDYNAHIIGNNIHDIGHDSNGVAKTATHNNGMVAIYDDSNNALIEQNFIHDIGRSNDVNLDHGVYMNGGGGNGDGNTVKNNVFKNFPRGWAVQMYPGTIKNATIVNNTFVDGKSNDTGTDKAGSLITTLADSVGSTVIQNSTISNNIFFDSRDNGSLAIDVYKTTWSGVTVSNNVTNGPGLYYNGGLPSGGNTDSGNTVALTTLKDYFVDSTAGTPEGYVVKSTAPPAVRNAGATGYPTGSGTPVCSGVGTFGANNWPAACWRPFADTSPFNRQITFNPADSTTWKLATNSAQKITYLTTGKLPQTITVNHSTCPTGDDDYYHPYFFAKSTDPKLTIDQTQYVGPHEGEQIYVPTSAKPACGGDHHLTVIQPNGSVEDFWNVSSIDFTNHVIKASAHGRDDLSGDGLQDWTTTAAWFSNLAGIMRAQELEAGQINHALFAIERCSDDAAVYPAHSGTTARTCAANGTSSGGNAMPMGARVWLAMTDSQIDALNANAWKKTILKALSHYGLILGDTGAYTNSGFSFGLQTESGMTYTALGYPDQVAAWAAKQGSYSASPSYMAIGDILDSSGASIWGKYLKVVDPCVSQGTCGTTPPPPPNNPVITSFTANPTTVAAGGTSTLSWATTDATSCTASASPSNSQWTGTKATSGTNVSISALTATTAFTLTCSGATGTTPATRSVTVTVTADTTPPDTTISSGPSGSTTSTSATFTYTSTESPSTFECKLDSAAFASCPSTGITYSGLAATSHTFSVRAIDAALNVDATPATRTWTVADTTPPDTTITAGPANGSSTTATTASFSFTSEVGATFECQLDTAAYAACSSPITYSGLAVGSHTFNVRAKDAAGNIDQTPATRQWTILAGDNTSPTVSLGSITDPITTSSVTITANATDPTGTNGATPSGVSRVEFYVDGNLAATDSTPDSSPNTYSFTWNAAGAINGLHTFSARAYDVAGNTPGVSANVTVTNQQPDTTPPTAPTGLSASATSPTSVSLNWTASTDTGVSNPGVASYRIYRGGIQITQVTGTSYIDSNLTASTQYSYQVSAVDNTGNESNKSTAVTVTTPAPPDTSAPTAPSNVVASVASVSSTSVQVNVTWTASSDPESGIKEYQIVRNGQLVNTISCNSTSNPCAAATLSYGENVSPSTTYTYTISAVNGAPTPLTASGTSNAITTPALPPPPPVNLIVAITDDASINGSSRSTRRTNYNGTHELNADLDPIRSSLMKFTISGTNGVPVTSAKLKLYVKDGSGDSTYVYPAASNSWSEGTVTWNTAPAAVTTRLLSHYGSTYGVTWMEINLGNLILGDGTYSIRMNGASDDGLYLNSKEAPSNKPQLILTLGS